MNSKPTLIFCFIILFFHGINFAQTCATITTQGNKILGPCGDTLKLKGVNYAPYNWGWTPGNMKMDEIALTGSNTVRIVWYASVSNPTPNSTYQNYALLDSVLSRCIANDMIAVLDLHDLTCQNDTAALITLSQWFFQPAIKTLINKYNHSLILNIANETLYLNWTNDSAKASQKFINTYTYIINNLRANQINVPLMIDAPDCGQHLYYIANVGSTLINNDPQHNVILSAHAYWHYYTNNDSTKFAQALTYVQNKNIPFVLGEIANWQDDAYLCQYALNYQALLRICEQKNMGWLAWVWDIDGCNSRSMSSTGYFANLTPYGNDLVNNNQYGLLTKPANKSAFLSGSCGCVQPVTNTTNITVQSAQLNWLANACSFGYKLQYRVWGNSTWQKINLPASATGYLLNGLLANTKYQWRVRNKCSADGALLSAWANNNFKTATLRASTEYFTDVNIFPNPAHSSFNIQTGKNQVYMYQVFNAYGTLLANGNFSTQLTLGETYKPGIYLLKLSTNDGAKTFRLVKE